MIRGARTQYERVFVCNAVSWRLGSGENSRTIYLAIHKPMQGCQTLLPVDARPLLFAIFDSKSWGTSERREGDDRATTH